MVTSTAVTFGCVGLLALFAFVVLLALGSKALLLLGMPGVVSLMRPPVVVQAARSGHCGLFQTSKGDELC